MRLKSGKYVFYYLAAIVAANIITAHFGPGASIFNAFVFVGLDLTSRDKLHESWKNDHLFLKMAALICSGSLISWGINRESGIIALASFVAFSTAGVFDAVVYGVLIKKRKMIKINGSNIVSAIVDSVIFVVIAFGWPPALLIILGQAAAKIIGGFVWSLIIYGRIHDAEQQMTLGI